MTRTEFIPKLVSTLEADPEQFCGNTVLTDLPHWDSLRLLELIALLDQELGVKLNASLLVRCQTAGELLGLVGEHLSE